jgi:hypothetical protein
MIYKLKPAFFTDDYVAMLWVTTEKNAGGAVKRSSRRAISTASRCPLSTYLLQKDR